MGIFWIFRPVEWQMIYFTRFRGPLPPKDGTRAGNGVEGDASQIVADTHRELFFTDRIEGATLKNAVLAISALAAIGLLVRTVVA